MSVNHVKRYLRTGEAEAAERDREFVGVPRRGAVQQQEQQRQQQRQQRCEQHAGNVPQLPRRRHGVSQCVRAVGAGFAPPGGHPVGGGRGRPQHRRPVSGASRYSKTWRQTFEIECFILCIRLPKPLGARWRSN